MRVLLVLLLLLLGISLCLASTEVEECMTGDCQKKVDGGDGGNLGVNVNSGGRGGRGGSRGGRSGSRGGSRGGRSGRGGSRSRGGSHSYCALNGTDTGCSHAGRVGGWSVQGVLVFIVMVLVVHWCKF